MMSCTSGLKDLADFLPASMVTIVSYLSAETTRGLWKHASMNGTDWPSPAGNLSMVEQSINKILAATGVDVPSLFAGMACVNTCVPINLSRSPVRGGKMSGLGGLANR